MLSLSDRILPQFQKINAEGGNMSAHLVHRPALDALEAEAISSPDAARLVAKIVETLNAYTGVRDHLRFNAFFEAYSEAVIFLAAKARGVALHAVPDGANRGKTPDFETESTPVVGLEVKTLNPVNPIAAVDEAMDEGFVAGYEAEQRSREAAKTSPNGVGVGISEHVWAPHGKGSNEMDAVVQTMSKISSNVKQGQYAGKPAFLVVSLARLGVQADAAELQRWVEEDGGQRNGLLYSIAAHPHDTKFIGFPREGWGDPVDHGILPRVGVLRDDPFIAGLIFVQLVGSEANSVDYLNYAVRFNGVWNSVWEKDSDFSDDEKAEARRVFETLCDAVNDLDDGGADDIVDDRSLHNAFFQHLEILKTRRGKPAAGADFEAFMVEAERLHFAWRGALRKVDTASSHVQRDPDEIIVGVLDDGRPVLTWPGPQTDPKVPLMALVKTAREWGLDEDIGHIRAVQVTL